MIAVRVGNEDVVGFDRTSRIKRNLDPRLFDDYSTWSKAYFAIIVEGSVQAPAHPELLVCCSDSYLISICVEGFNGFDQISSSV